MSKRELNYRNAMQALLGCDRSNVVVRKGDTPTIDLFGVIFDDEWEGITPTNLSTVLDDLGEVEQINVRINSPGGVITGAVSMYNLLKSHSAKINIEVIGEASSSAGWLVQVGDVRRMHENSTMMLHNAISWRGGNKHQLAKEIEVLSKLENTIVGSFASRSGKSAEDVQAMLDAETWLTAEEAIEHGFADEIIPNKGKKTENLANYYRELELDEVLQIGD